MVVMIFGLPGSGKTYFAEKLAKRLNATHLNTDKIRKDLDKQGQYDEESKKLVYNEMAARMEECIKNDKNVIIDATFYKSSIRNKFIHKTEKHNANIFYIEMKASEKTIMKRLESREGFSEADYKVYKQIKTEYEPFYEPHLTIWSDRHNAEQMVNKAINYFNIKVNFHYEYQ